MKRLNYVLAVGGNEILSRRQGRVVSTFWRFGAVLWIIAPTYPPTKAGGFPRAY